MLSGFGNNTPGWVLIHVLSCLFSVETSVRCANVIERIESLVRQNEHIMSCQPNRRRSLIGRFVQRRVFYFPAVYNVGLRSGVDTLLDSTKPGVYT